MKLLYVLAIISSLLNTLMLIFQIALKPFINKKYYEDIVSKIISPNTLKQVPYNRLENILKNIPQNKLKSVSPNKEYFVNDEREKVETIMDIQMNEVNKNHNIFDNQIIAGKDLENPLKEESN